MAGYHQMIPPTEKRSWLSLLRNQLRLCINIDILRLGYLMIIGRKYLLVVLILVVLALLSCEIFARYYLGLGTPPLSIEHPQIEYMFKPDQDIYRFGNRIVINHYGMRTMPFAASDSNDVRIMIFGDSVLNGGSLTDHDSLATTILQKKLAEKIGKKVIVGNISAGSWGPANWLAYAEEYGFFNASAVILIISSHDYTDNPTFQPLDKNTHPTSNPTFAFIEGVTRYLPRYLPQFKQSDNSDDIGSLLENDIQNRSHIGLRKLKEFLLLAKDKSQFVLVFQYWEKEEIERGEAKYGNSRIREVCESLGIYPIQLMPYFQHSLNIGNDPYRDDIHPNLIGQEVIATALLENLPDDVLHLPR